MQREDSFDRFDLNEETTLDQQVKSQGFFPDKALIGYADKFLVYDFELAQIQLLDQAPFVDRLEKTWAFLAVYVDRGGDGDA